MAIGLAFSNLPITVLIMLNNKTDLIEPGPGTSQPSDGETLDAELGSADVGTRIRRLRKVYGLSQRELAKRAGVTNGAISMIEQNRVSPSVASLKKILAVLGLSLAEFFADEFEPDKKCFYRAHEMNHISEGAVTLRQVGGKLSGRQMQVLHEIYEPGGDTGPDMLKHDGEESGVIIRGAIELTVGSQCEVLGKGDGYYFSSQLPHRFRNIGKVVCEIVSSCTPPTF